MKTGFAELSKNIKLKFPALFGINPVLCIIMLTYEKWNSYLFFPSASRILIELCLHIMDFLLVALGKNKSMHAMYKINLIYMVK